MIGDNFMWFPESSGKARPLGETTDSWFAAKKAFELSNFQFNMNNSESTDQGTSGAAKAAFGEFSVEKAVDSASVPLYKACSLGTKFPTIMMAIRKSGGSNLLYMQYIFRDCQVTGITWSGGSGDKAPSENLTFKFKAMGFQYIPQKPDGTQGIALAWSWNTAVNQATLDMKGLDPAPDYVSGSEG